MFGYEYERRKIAKLKGRDYLWLGMIGQAVGLMVIVGADDPGSTISIVGEGMLVLFTGVLVGGCAKFTRYHGLNRCWALLGFLNVIGVLMLIDIPRWGRGKNRGRGFDVDFAEPYHKHVWRMDVRVKLDEIAEANVHDPIMLQVPRGANVGSAMKVLAGVIPGLYEGELPTAGYWINGVRADRRAELSDGDELVVRKGE